MAQQMSRFQEMEKKEKDMQQKLALVEEESKKKVAQMLKEVNQTQVQVTEDRKVIKELKHTVNTSSLALSKSYQILQSTKKDDAAKLEKMNERYNTLDKSTRLSLGELELHKKEAEGKFEQAKKDLDSLNKTYLSELKKLKDETE